MIDILIRFEFRFTDRRGRNQSGAVMRGCRIGQIIIGIDQFLVFLSLSWAVTSVKVIIGLKYAKKYFLYRRERSGGIKAFFRHAIEYKKRRTFQRIAP